MTERGAWSSTDGTVHLAERRPDSSVAVRRLTAAGLSEAVLLGGQTQSAPAIVKRASGSLEVYVRGGGDVLQVARRRPSGSWTGWTSLGGTVTGPPGVALDGDDQVHLLARGSDGAVTHRASPAPGSYAPSWDDLGGRLYEGTGPSATCSAPGRTDVVVQGRDHGVKLTSYAGARSGFSPLGFATAGTPAVAAPAGELLVVAAAADGVPHSWTAASGWSSLGGRLLGAPVLACAPGSGRAVVLGTGTDGRLLRGTWTAGAWSGWSRA